VGGESLLEVRRLSGSNIDSPLASSSPGDMVANSLVNNWTEIWQTRTEWTSNRAQWFRFYFHSFTVYIENVHTKLFFQHGFNHSLFSIYYSYYFCSTVSDFNLNLKFLICVRTQSCLILLYIQTILRQSCPNRKSVRPNSIEITIKRLRILNFNKWAALVWISSEILLHQKVVK